MIVIDIMQDLHAGSIDLNLLLALDALLLERNVTRAASRVGLTQSAMSHKLRKLRELFDDDLLVGGRHGMVVTARAEMLAGPVRRALLDLHAAVRNTVSFDPATAQRTFTIMTSDYADFVVLPRVLAFFEKNAPGVSLRIRNKLDRVQARLEDGSADLAVGFPVDGANLKKTTVIEENFVVIARADHPEFVGGKTLTIRRYLKYGHVLVSSDSAPGVVDSALAERGLERRIVLRTPYFVGMPFLVGRSDLLATVPRSLAKEASAFVPLTMMPPPIPLESFRITMTWHERTHRDPAHRWMRDLSRRLTVEALADSPG